jgi:hypothetical protein
MLTIHRRYTYPPAMEQVRTGEQSPPSGGGAMSKAASAKDRVDSALSRLESMVEDRLRAEASRADDLAKRLDKLERQHDELKKVAMEVEGRLERAMEYIRSLLAADQS